MILEDLRRSIDSYRLPISESQIGVVRPKQCTRTVFNGWGSRLFSIILAATALGLCNAAAMAFPVPDGTDTCSVPDRDAALVSHPIPEYPETARFDGARGEVVLRVDISPEGAIEKVMTETTSGNIFLDREATRIARSSLYTPAISHCQPYSTSVLYTIAFVD